MCPWQSNLGSSEEPCPKENVFLTAFGSLKEGSPVTRMCSRKEYFFAILLLQGFNEKIYQYEIGVGDM